MKKKSAQWVVALLFLWILFLGGKARAQINMTNGSTTTCGTTFYDSGGGSYNYDDGEDLVYTIYPQPGSFLRAAFSFFEVETCCDHLRIYNGNSTAAALIGTYTANPGTITSTAPDGSLTFQFHSDGMVGGGGFEAYVYCTAPCAGTPAPGNTLSSNPAPCIGTNFNLSLQNDAGSNSTYQWQSSTDGVTYNNVPTGGTGPTYSISQTVATYYQCIVTCSTGGSSATSTPVQVGIGSCINMANGSTTTCGGTFYDSGGPTGYYGNNEDMVFTIYPQPGNFLRAAFSLLEVETCCDDLKIYNGNSTAAPLIGTFNTYPGIITSTAPDGSLTFQFHSDEGSFLSGWEAALSCVPNPPCTGQPNPGTATGPASAVCPDVDFTINVQTPLLGSGVAYQWQSSPDGSAWSDVAGQTSGVFLGSQAQALSYRLRAICLAGPDTGYSGVATVAIKPFMDCYCSSYALSTTDEDVTNVTFAGINNTSIAGDCALYTDYTSITGTAFVGGTYPISVTTGDCESADFFPRKVSVFIDWNRNGLFTDPGELVFDPANTAGDFTVGFNGNVTVPATAGTGITKMRVICREDVITTIDPCGGYGNGETEDYLLNVLPVPANEAGVVAITKPELIACDLGSKIWVNLQNLGTNPLTSAKFTVKVNGLNLNAPVWNGNVPPQGTAEIMLPVDYTLSDGDSIYVEVSLPNGQPENPLMAFNNIAARRIYTGLSGVKTVYGPGANFATVDAAVQALQMRGVCDTVYFRIASGTYTTQHVLPQYPGAGPGKLAVFESASGNAAAVTFSFGAADAGSNYVFRFDGGDGYMLRNLTANNAGADFSRVIDITNGSKNLTFENNVLVGDTTAAYSESDTDRIVVASLDDAADHNITVRNNRILGGNRAISLGAMGGGPETGIVVEGNTVEKYAVVGVLLEELSNCTVKNNVFRARANLTEEESGIFIYSTTNGGLVEGNDVSSSRPGPGIYLGDMKGGTSPVYVTNNFVYRGATGATGISRGIEVTGVNGSDIVLANNSISIASDNNVSGGIAVGQGSNIRLFNNNVGAFGDAPAIRIGTSAGVTASDNNNLYGTSLLANVGGDLYITLAALQAATGRDANSKSVNPGFNGTDLHTCAPALNAAGMPLAYVVSDFDRDTRSATPDIGADEFMGDAKGLLAEDVFLKCPAEQVTIGNPPMNGVTYAWTPSGGTSQITTATAGPHVVTATGSCGSFSDTATVTNKPMPVGSFTSVSSGLTATFTNTSTGGTSYLWNFGDGSTSTDISPSHAYAVSGTYSVTLTVTNECGSVIYGPQPVNVSNAGIDEQHTVNVNLFPNPTDGLFNISLNGTTNAVTVNVVDMAGKTVLVENVPAGVSQIILDATTFAPGIYSVKITNGIDFNQVIRMVRK